MLHKRCNTDVLGVLLIYPHTPSGAACPRDRAYILVKPLAAVLQSISKFKNIQKSMQTCITILVPRLNSDF